MIPGQERLDVGVPVQLDQASHAGMVSGEVFTEHNRFSVRNSMMPGCIVVATVCRYRSTVLPMWGWTIASSRSASDAAEGLALRGVVAQVSSASKSGSVDCLKVPRFHGSVSLK